MTTITSLARRSWFVNRIEAAAQIVEAIDGERTDNDGARRQVVVRPHAIELLAARHALDRR